MAGAHILTRQGLRLRLPARRARDGAWAEPFGHDHAVRKRRLRVWVLLGALFVLFTLLFFGTVT